MIECCVKTVIKQHRFFSQESISIISAMQFVFVLEIEINHESRHMYSH